VSSDLGTRDLVGYARVSTDEQNLDLQLDALMAAGCKRVFRDVGSGTLKHRPQLDACLDHLRAGDTLVVWRLDRLGRGLKHLIESIDALHTCEVGFRSLTKASDTTTPAGRLQFHIFGALAEFEREIIRERTRAGLAAARARGRLGGRPSPVSAEKLAAAEAMRAREHSMRDIAAALGVSRATLHRHLAGSRESAGMQAVGEEGRIGN
jgi:DNA invertase Pin-like site-specific DNA recombinase